MILFAYLRACKWQSATWLADRINLKLVGQNIIQSFGTLLPASNVFFSGWQYEPVRYHLDQVNARCYNSFGRRGILPVQ